MEEKAPQRMYPLREVFNRLRCLVKGGRPWRLIPHDVPPWEVVYQQKHNVGSGRGCLKRWCMIFGRCCACRKAGRRGPTVAIIDSRTLQSTPESGARSNYDGAKGGRAAKFISQ